MKTLKREEIYANKYDDLENLRANMSEKEKGRRKSQPFRKSGDLILVAAACNHPNCLVLTFRFLVRVAA
jgi:hypothetical protein